jgi:hypothetical protein
MDNRQEVGQGNDDEPMKRTMMNDSSPNITEKRLDRKCFQE